MSQTSNIVSIVVDGDPIKVVFNDTENHSLELDTIISRQQLPAINQQMNENLSRFLNQVGLGKNVEIGIARRALFQLHKDGAGIMNTLFRRKDIDRLKRFMNTTFPEWRTMGGSEYSPVVELRGRIDSLLPFEFMPIFNNETPATGPNKDDLLLLACHFPGFSTRMARVLYPFAKDISLTNIEINNIPQLRIRMFRNRELHAMDEEEKYLATEPSVQLFNEWPQTADTDQNLVSQLAAQLWNASDSLIPLPVLDHIHHFTCHCNMEMNFVGQDHIILTAPGTFFDALFGNRKLYVRVSDLNRELGVLPDRDFDVCYPLVFMNACGSANVSVDKLYTFPTLFLKDGNRGFIGTEYSIPQEFANHFSQNFYKAFLQKQTIATALHTSRWEMLKRFNNPLGIFYTAFANPELHLKKKSEI